MKKLLFALLILSVVVFVGSCSTPDTPAGNDPAVTTDAQGDAPAVTTEAQGDTPAVTTEAQTPGADTPVVKPDYVVKKLTIGGVDISEFVIVLGPNMTENERHLATLLQKKIYEVCKVEIRCVSHTEPEQKNEILFGKTGRAASEMSPMYGKGSARQTDSKLAFVGNGTDGNGSMMRYLEFLLDAIPAGESYDIRIADFDNVEISQPHLTETNMPSTFSDVTGAYDPDFTNVKNVVDRFNYSVASLPDEITVLSPFEVESFPKSAEKTVFVAPNGNDSNSGTIDAPLATLAAAVKKVSGGGVIYLRGGVYDTTGAGDITARGTMSSPVIVTPYQNENVTFVVGKQLSASVFKPLDTANDPLAERIPASSWDSVVYVDLFSLGWTESELGSISASSPTSPVYPALYINDTMGEISRYPNSNEPMLYFQKVNETGSVTLRDSSSLYNKWIKRVKNWDSWKKAGGTESTTYSFDKGLYNNLKEAVADAQKLDAVSSTRYTDEYGNLNMDLGWSIKLEDLAPLKNKWVNTGDIWFFGNTYSGYRFYTCQIAEFDKKTVSVSSVHGTPLGATPSSNSPTGYNNYYFFNVLEALDYEGEWYVDKSTGYLYVYKTADFDNATLTYCTSTAPILNLVGCSNMIIDGIDTKFSSGEGICLTNCDDVVIQRCEAGHTGSNAIYVRQSTDCAIIYNEVYDGGDTLISFSGSMKDIGAASATRHVVQNNHCHSPRYSVKLGISISGAFTVASHNKLEDNGIYLSNTAECVVEYNDVKGGSLDVTDGGLIYLGLYDNFANHIRYNYLHDWNISDTGVYFDDLSCFNYAYGNIIDTSTKTSEGEVLLLYSSSGHYNVFFGNLLVGRGEDSITESSSYFDENQPSGYRFEGWAQKFVDTAKSYSATFYKHFPEMKIFYDMMKQHKDELKASSYVRNDLEIYLRAPAKNVIMNNIILGAETPIVQSLLKLTNSVTGELMTSTDLIQNNYHSTNVSSVLANHLNGDYTVSDSALSAITAIIPDFTQLTTENAGLTYER